VRGEGLTELGKGGNDCLGGFGEENKVIKNRDMQWSVFLRKQMIRGGNEFGI
jgi:hypothetical protein